MTLEERGGSLMRKLVAPAIGALATFVLVAAPAADAKSKWADVRVVSKTGETLADHRQYTDDVTVRTSREAKCFIGSKSTNGRYKLGEPSVLGALIDSSRSVRDLRPLLLTDAFFDDFGGFGVCGIGGIEGTAKRYWYSAVNGIGAQAGPNQIEVRNGDDNLWYLAAFREDFSSPSELSVAAPTAVLADEPFEVSVTRTLADGTTEPAAGASVGGEITDQNGMAELTLNQGTTALVATGGQDDVPSAKTRVCAADSLSDCPSRFGIRIFGSDGNDEIKSTAGKDKINCRRGNDIVREAQKVDKIAPNCEKVRRT